jgi:protein involved in polysaccharide export with SLBB domain
MFGVALVFCLAGIPCAQTNPPAQDSFSSDKPTAPKPDRARTVKEDDGAKGTAKPARETARDLYKAGIKYAKAHLFRQAVQSFQEAIKYDPLFIDAYFALGHANIDLGNFNEAIAAYEKIIALDPQIIEAYTAIGQAYVKLKESGQLSDPTNESNVRATTAANEKSRSKETEVTTDELNKTRIYRVGVGDGLNVLLPGIKPEESVQLTVSNTGEIEHPVLGRSTKVAGLTTDEISLMFDSELKKTSLRTDAKPQVTVSDYNSHSILISGLVKEPGPKILRREALPLYVVLADSQPLPEAAFVTIISQRGNKTQTVDITNARETAMLVLPGDVLNVQAAAKQFVYVGGSVKSPGEIPFRSGLSLTQAIISAGGISDKCERAQVSRSKANGLLSSQEFKLKDIDKGKVPDPLVEPGDRILVLP